MTKTTAGLMVALVITLAWTGSARAEGDEPISQEKQQKLLDKFGDQGIDANGDGVLTRDEVVDFLAEKATETKGRKGKRKGPRSERGERELRSRKGGEGRREHAGLWGPGRREGAVDGLLRRLEQLEAETPPEDFDLSRSPDADADGNGELSTEEWAAFATKAQERLLDRLARMEPEADANEDGKIDEDELAKFKAQRQEEIRAHVLENYPEADTDGDGKLSDEELEAHRRSRADDRRTKLLERYPEADTDGDGELSDEEARAFMKDKMGERRRGGRRGDHEGRRGRRGRGGDKPAEGQPM
ncbi:MAG: hypothetical protein GY778_22990 [bacterium]|nr:hypothetical protein [bacterium]